MVTLFNNMLIILRFRVVTNSKRTLFLSIIKVHKYHKINKRYLDHLINLEPEKGLIFVEISRRNEE